MKYQKFQTENCQEKVKHFSKNSNKSDRTKTKMKARSNSQRSSSERSNETETRVKYNQILKGGKFLSRKVHKKKQISTFVKIQNS